MFLFLLSISPVAWGQTVRGPRGIEIQSERVLIVTHASTRWDPQKSIKREVDRAVRMAKKIGVPVVHLVDSDIQSYFFEDRKPTYAISSPGRISFKVKVPHVITQGGKLEDCLRHSHNDYIDQLGRFYPDRDVRITNVYAGTYIGWAPGGTVYRFVAGMPYQEKRAFFMWYVRSLRRAVAHQVEVYLDHRWIGTIANLNAEQVLHFDFVAKSDQVF